MRGLIGKGFAFFILGILVISCAPEQSRYHGEIYFGQGSYLLMLRLGDGSVSVVYNFGDKTIRDISGLESDKLLIAETSLVNRKTVSGISWFDLKTGQSTVLYSGVLARYLAGAGVIVYDDGAHLFAVPQWGTGANETVFSHGQNQLTALLEVSGDTLLFEVADARRHAVYSWNALTGDLQPREALAAACRLHGAVWIDQLQRLACKAGARADADYVLADLEGVVDGKLQLPAGKQFLALAYISGQNAVVLKESWRSAIGKQEKSALWIHDIQSGDSRRLARHQQVSTAAVYAEF